MRARKSRPDESVTARGEYSTSTVTEQLMRRTAPFRARIRARADRGTRRLRAGRVVNRERQIGAYEVFNLHQLPFHFVWRMLGEGSYVVGIEPSTNRTGGRLDPASGES